MDTAYSKRSTPSRQKQLNLLIIDILFVIIAILKSALRDFSKMSIGNDTFNYMSKYFEVANTTWSQLFHDFSLISTSYEVRDFGYPIFVKLTQLIAIDFRFFLFIVASIYVIPLGMILYKHVKSYSGIFFGILLYFALFSSLVDTAFRQCIAMGICWFGLDFVIQRKWKQYFLLVLIAFTIHSTAFLAVPMYFFPKLKNMRSLIIVLLIAMPFMIIYSSQIAAFLTEGSIYESYSEHAGEYGSPLVFTGMIILVTIVTVLFYKQIQLERNASIFIGSIIMATALTPMGWVAPAILRMTWYYSVFIMALIPMIINGTKINRIYKQLMYAGVDGILLFLMIR